MKKLLVLSGKGGTGKTTVASSIIEFSKTKAFADCDVDAPNLHLIQNFENKPETKAFIGSKKQPLIIKNAHFAECAEQIADLTQLKWIRQDIP